jgi:hypothetical protein
MTQPLISIIMPVGPRHSEHARMAAASVVWQSLSQLCELVIACDGGAYVSPIASTEKMPGVTILNSDGERRGPAQTRNRAIAAARGKFILPLDADDYLLPRTVEHFLREYSRGQHSYVYGDCYTLEPDGRYLLRSAPDYVQKSYIDPASGQKTGGMDAFNAHVVTILIPTKIAREVGGYDEGVDAWEDWTFHLRLAIAGYCGHRIPMPVFGYRVYEGDRMTRFYGGAPEHMQKVWDRYRNEKGDIPMASCCGGDSELARIAADAVRGAPAPDAAPMADDKVRVEFLGEERGTLTWEYSRGRSIRLGNNAMNRYADLTREEAAWLNERAPIRIVPIFDGPEAPTPLQPIVADADVLTPDAIATKALRPRGRPPLARSEATV